MQAPPESLITARDWLSWAEKRFTDAGLYFGHGCDNAFDEAAWLILHALKQPLNGLDAMLDVKLDKDQCQSIYDLLNRRISERIPSAYLTRQAWLGDFYFYVDERVIVPRSYFAELLEHGLLPWVTDDMPVRRALDLCTGSGCLAILMAMTFADAKIDAVDVSMSALDVARLNVERYQLGTRVELIESDLFGAVSTRQYDLIISNPPYVTTEAMRLLPAEYLHEPGMALAAGADGLDIVRRILHESARHLTPHGILMVEVGHNAELVEAAFPDIPFTRIDTESSEQKIFLLSRQELHDYFT